MRELPPSLPILGFLDGGEQSDVYWCNVVLDRGKPSVARATTKTSFHSLGGAKVILSAIRCQLWALDAKCGRRGTADFVVLAKGTIIRSLR